ncbi:MAG: hypothetical protein CSA44_03080 [Gammaproteobacteria bacterium]|nr:MAG: hypothetical protein CSA44_03080 [Gammaproteobacteria bacterium]
MTTLAKHLAITLLLITTVFTQSVRAEDNILPYWQQQMLAIDEGLAKMQNLYQKGDRKTALEIAKTTHFSYYRNSDLEAAIRTNVSMQYAETINQRLFTLTRLINEDGEHSKKITSLVNKLKADIRKTLPDLPLTPKLIREQQARLAQKKALRIENKNYSEDIKALHNALHQVLTQYKEAQTDKALRLIQENFYQHWQISELEASLSPEYKHSVEQVFDKLYKSIRQNQPVAEVEQYIQHLNSALQQTPQHKIQVSKRKDSQWQVVIFCLAGLAVIFLLFIAFRRHKRLT